MGDRWKDSTLSIRFNPSYSCLRRMWVRQAAGGKKSEPPSFERESKKCPWIQPFLPHSPSHIRIRYTAYRRGRVKRDPLAPLTGDKRGCSLNRFQSRNLIKCVWLSVRRRCTHCWNGNARPWAELGYFSHPSIDRAHPLHQNGQQWTDLYNCDDTVNEIR